LNNSSAPNLSIAESSFCQIGQLQSEEEERDQSYGLARVKRDSKRKPASHPP
jgi:hypothetical protein